MEGITAMGKRKTRNKVEEMVRNIDEIEQKNREYKNKKVKYI